jgi:hypothetical protein
MRFEGQHGPRVELADPRFGDAEDLADLLEGHLLVVVEGEDQFFSFGQILDSAQQLSFLVALLDDLSRVGLAGIFEGLVCADLALGRGLLERI